MEINDVFIYIENNNIEKSKCDEIIERFENDNRKLPGIVADGLAPDYKNTQDLLLFGLDEWKDIDDLLFTKLHDAINKYLRTEITSNSNDVISMNLFGFGEVVDLGYNIQKYNVNEGFYHWHSDFINNKHKINLIRLLSFIWYLNDVTDGGETEFLKGKIKPRAGKLIIFPSSWNYYHKGNMPLSNDKYIITGWVGILNKQMTQTTS